MSALDWLALHAPDLYEARAWVAAAVFAAAWVVTAERGVPRG